MATNDSSLNCIEPANETPPLHHLARSREQRSDRIGGQRAVPATAASCLLGPDTPPDIANPQLLPPEVLQVAMRYVNDHLDAKLTWESIASAVGLDRFRLGRGFKLAAGTTLHQYVTSCRIAEAMKLLAREELSIDEIARGVGFSRQSHLNKRFRKHTGTTPAAFRRSATRNTRSTTTAPAAGLPNGVDTRCDPACPCYRRLPQHVLQLTIQHITDHLDTKLTWDSIATAMGMDPFRLGRGFKRAVGITLHRYVTFRRVAQAMKLLKAPEHGIADIALEVGFSCQSHLTTLFRKHTGTTPAAFRRAARTNAGPFPLTGADAAFPLPDWRNPATELAAPPAREDSTGSHRLWEGANP